VTLTSTLQPLFVLRAPGAGGMNESTPPNPLLGAVVTYRNEGTGILTLHGPIGTDTSLELPAGEAVTLTYLDDSVWHFTGRFQS
jgi:hypothetical protein